MCGRFTSTHEAADVARRFAVALPEGYRPRFNIAPTQRALAVVLDPETGSRQARLARFGLVPHWAKDASRAARMINARAETLLERPAYRPLVRAHRCLVPADGFYEWRAGAGRQRLPVRFTLARGELFAFAGLFATWLDRERGEPIDSFTIVTTAANGLVAELHDRMPVILPGELEEPWLDPGVPPEAALTFLVPYPAEAMVAAPASIRVNSVANDDPGVLVPEDAPG
ncbi:MAG: SOS response-associated peptidase [Thermoleophilia bacterium]|nr:SOS response-associated peptidase [Thermoleophilia bacterium]